MKFGKKSEEFTEDEINVSFLEPKNINSGNSILKKFRAILHKEIRDWIVYPFQKKQTKFNRKVAHNISKIQTNLNEAKLKIDELNSLIIKNDLDLSKKIEESIHFNLARRIESLIEEKSSSNIEVFEIKMNVKKNFLEILKRYPSEKELEQYVTKIKNNEMNFSDLEKELKNK